jgi:hypothetical protein
MLELQLAVDFEAPMSAVFGALVRALGEGRWLAAHEADDALVMPHGGLRYSARCNGYACSGEVLECLRPVSIVLQESLTLARSGAACRQRWRVEPFADATRVCCELRANLSRIARLQKRAWHDRLTGRCERALADIRETLARAPAVAALHNGAIGQSIGNVSIVSTKMMTVSGKPTFR